jgi:hypothetical protein
MVACGEGIPNGVSPFGFCDRRRQHLGVCGLQLCRECIQFGRQRAGWSAWVPACAQGSISGSADRADGQRRNLPMGPFCPSQPLWGTANIIRTRILDACWVIRSLSPVVETRPSLWLSCTYGTGSRCHPHGIPLLPGVWCGRRSSLGFHCTDPDRVSSLDMSTRAHVSPGLWRSSATENPGQVRWWWVWSMGALHAESHG